MTAALKFNLTARSLAAVMLGVVVVLAAAGWLVVVGPKRSEVTRLDSTLQAKQTQLTTAEHAQQAAAGGTQAEQSGVASAALPDTVAMPQVVDQLNALATRAGVSLDTVTPSGAVPGSGYEAVPLNIVVDGHYFAVEQFLHRMRAQVNLSHKGKLHASGRLFDVQSVQLQQTEPAPMVTATIAVRAFFYSGLAAPAPVATEPAADSTTSTG